MLSPAQLHDLLAKILSGAAGGTEAEWRSRVGLTVLPLAINPHSNWLASAAGTAKQRAAIEAAAELVRAEHPYVKS